MLDSVFPYKQVRESSHSAAYADADRLLKKRHGDIVTGKFAGLEPDRITILELLREVEQDCRDNLRSSLPQLLSRLKNHLISGNIRAAELSSDHIKRYRSKRLTEGAARATINREVETLQRAWKLAQMCDPPRVNVLFPHVRRAQHSDGFPGGGWLPGTSRCSAGLPEAASANRLSRAILPREN